MSGCSVRVLIALRVVIVLCVSCFPVRCNGVPVCRDVNGGGRTCLSVACVMMDVSYVEFYKWCVSRVVVKPGAWSVQ